MVYILHHFKRIVTFDISLYEVGPRDGLQNLSYTIPTETKVRFIETLHAAGLCDLEVGSFVNPKHVPTMADTADVFAQIKHLDGDLGVLVPNKRGFERAVEVGAKKFNVFFSPSEDFNLLNFGYTRKKIVANYQEILEDVPKDDVRVYLSSIFGHPISNTILQDAIQDADSLGNTIVLCDTIGAAYPISVKQVVQLAFDNSDADIAMHLHFGTKQENRMIMNIEAAYFQGIRMFDCSIGGLGGCPFISDSGGNLPTEIIVEWAESQNIDCGIHSRDLKDALSFVENEIKEGIIC